MKNTFLFCLLLVLSSCDDTILQEDLDQEMVSILAPMNGVNITSDTIVFSWEKLDGADSYRVQVASPSFSNAQQIVLDQIVTELSLTSPLEAGLYEWRIQGFNDASESSYTVSSFEVQ